MENKMRVLFIAGGDYKYGASKSMMSLILYLKGHYDVEPVLLTKQRNKLNMICDENGIENHSCWYCDFMSGSPYSFFPLKVAKHAVKYTLYIAGSILQKRILSCGIDFDTIDIIHTNHSRIQVGAYISTKKKIPHVWHIREFGREDYNVFFYRPNTIKYMNRHAGKFIVISDAVKRSWIAKGLDEKKITTVYNGLDAEGYISKKNRNDDYLKIVVVGHVQKSKGQIHLIQALSMLPEKIRNSIQVDIVGEGYKDYISQIKRLININHLENIHFLGYQENIPCLLAEYDVGVMCSASEGFGRVTVEYMLAGLYVVATDSGANPEIIKSLEQGMLYTDGDPAGLANCLKEIFECRGKYCKGNVKENMFTLEAYASGVYSVYKELLANKKDFG